MFIAKPGLPVLICARTGSDVMRLGQETAIKFFAAGGFLVSKCPLDTLELPEVLAKFQELNLKKSDINAAKQLADYPVIGVLTDVVELLPKWVTDAMILHEVGHIVNGDLGKIVDVSQQVNGFYLNADAEIAADAYAAERVGKKTFAKALVCLLETIGKIVATNNGKVPFNEEIYQKYISESLLDPIVRRRFDALQ